MSVLRQRPIWLWSVGAIALVLAVNGAAWLPRFTTSGPAYCLSCHGVGDTPDRGVPSQVPPGFDKVGCVDCHASSGASWSRFVFTEGYRGGYSANKERLNANCQSCHSQ